MEKEKFLALIKEEISLKEKLNSLITETKQIRDLITRNDEEKVELFEGLPDDVIAAATSNEVTTLYLTAEDSVFVINHDQRSYAVPPLVTWDKKPLLND